MRRIIRQRVHRSGCCLSNLSSWVRRLSTEPTSGSAYFITTTDNRASSLRKFSTRMHTVSTPSNAMLSPFLIGGHELVSKDKTADADIAFMGLLKAMSVLKSSPSNDHIIHLGKNKRDDKKVTEIDNRVAVSVDNWGETEEKGLNASTKLKRKGKDRSSINIRVQEAMTSKNIKKVVDIAKESMVAPQGQQLNDVMFGRTVHFLSYEDLHTSFEALKFLTQRSKDNGKLVRLDIYRRVIEGIFHANIGGAEMLDLGEEIYYHIRDSFSEDNTVIYQHILLPALVWQLVRHRDRRVNQCAKPIVEYMIAQDFPLLNPELHEAILNEASLNRVGHHFLPYHTLLKELVLRGYKPSPSTVHNLLECYYPYRHGLDATYDILEAIQKLARDAEGDSTSYRINLGTLESISMASNGRTDLTLLVWDLAELFKYKPTECMFEDAVLSFGTSREDGNSFRALLDMENSGYLPSHVFLRRYSLQLSKYKKRLVHVQNLLGYNHDGQFLSSSAMNCLLLGYGMHKDLEKSFETFENFGSYNVQANDITFAYLMEALWLNVKERQKTSELTDEDIDDILAVVDIVIRSMQLAGVEGSSSFIYEHMRLLCLLKKFDDAKLILESAIENGLAIKTGSIVLIATGYLEVDDIETARKVANLSVAAGCGEAPNFLMKRIQDREMDQ